MIWRRALFTFVVGCFIFAVKNSYAKAEIRIPGRIPVIEIVTCECDINNDGVPESVSLFLLRCDEPGGYCIIIEFPDQGPPARAKLYEDGQLIETKEGIYCGPGPSGDPEVDAYFYETD